MGNREYKSDVFCMLLEDRKNALALKTAIDECIENNILRDFLIERRSEVEKNMQLDLLNYCIQYVHLFVKKCIQL